MNQNISEAVRCAKHSEHYDIMYLAQAVGELLETLPQPEQEPVAWSYWQSCLNDDGTQTAPWVHRLSKFKPSESVINKDITPLYTTPPQRKPLTFEQVEDCFPEGAIFAEDDGWLRVSAQTLHDIARAIEAAHGIKE